MPRLAFSLIIFIQNLNFSIQFSFDLDTQLLYKLDRGCKDVDIRNSEHFYLLKNCDRVHGYLRLSNFIFDEKIEPFEISEITGYLLIEDVENLKNLSQVLPNLIWIKGEKLYNSKYALVIKNNNDLDLGTDEIIYIKHGEVQVENNLKANNESFKWKHGEPPNLCNDEEFSTCTSKICKRFLKTSLDTSYDEKKCVSTLSAGLIILEDRYAVTSDVCSRIGRINFQLEKCILESDTIQRPEYYACDEEPIKNCTIFVNGTESLKDLEGCAEPTRVEILNLDENFNQVLLDKVLSQIIKIKDCLIVSNSSVIKNLHGFKKLRHICEGCEWKRSNYQIIIERNENLESLFPHQSKINIAEHKTLINENPKLNDKNGIFKCNLGELSVEIIARQNSALIMTYFEMIKDTNYEIFYKSIGDGIRKKNMENNLIELTNLSPNEHYSIFFEINLTKTTDNDYCSFKTFKRNEFFVNFQTVRNSTEIEIKWNLTRDVSFLKYEGYKLLMVHREISKDKNCHENQAPLQNRRKYGNYFLSPISQNHLHEGYNLSLPIERNSLIVDNLENATCYRFEFLACVERNLILCEPSVYVYARTFGNDENYTQEASILIILLVCFIVLIATSLIFSWILFFKKKAKRDEIISIQMKNLHTCPQEVTYHKNKIIGKGHFGKVYVGYLNGDKDTIYAIKVSDVCLTDEALLMGALDTHHIVKLIKHTVTEDNKPCLVMEYMKHGDLKTFLQTNRPRDVPQAGTYTLNLKPIRPVWEMAIEIADGMLYLAEKNIIHNDLAARNCLIHQDYTIKIGDFGMARSLNNHAYYKSINPKLLPLRWLSPEALDEIPIFTVASDVYSYGVVLYELVTYGSITPYSEFTDEQAKVKIMRGEILEQPENCDDKIYSLMTKCWEFDRSQRITFKDIIRFILENFPILEKFRSVSYYHQKK